MTIFVICGLGVEDRKNGLLEIYYFLWDLANQGIYGSKTNTLNDLKQILYIFATVSLDLLRRDVDSNSV